MPAPLVHDCVALQVGPPAQKGSSQTQAPEPASHVPAPEHACCTEHCWSASGSQQASQTHVAEADAFEHVPCGPQSVGIWHAPP